MPNAYLRGNWAPVLDERDDADLHVTGRLPDELAGTFLRNGPNPQFAPLGRHHWFDGDGMVHAVRLQGGRASYRNRWVQTRGLLLEREAGRALWAGIMEPPQSDLPEQSPILRTKKNVANTALIRHAGRLFTFYDSAEPYLLDPETLATLGPFTFDGALRTGFASHPKIDPVTGEMMFMGAAMRRPARLHYGVIDAAGTLCHAVELPIPHASYVHDLAITERYTVLLDMPLLFDPRRLLTGASAYEFARGMPCRIGVIPRHGRADEVRWFETDTCFIAHTVNAWDEGDAVVLVAGRMDEIELGAAQLAGGPIYNSTPMITRFRLDLRSGRVEVETLERGAAEFFQVSAARLGRRSRVAWAGRLSPYQLFALGGVARIDLETGRADEFSFGAGRFGGDFQVVARRGATAEDDAWLLVLVHDEWTDISSLLVLDARAPSRGPLASVHLRRRVPYGVHSLWLAAAA